MQQIIIEKPYQFIPPHRGTWLPWLILKSHIVDYYLRKVEGVASYEIRGLDHFRESLRLGHGILIAPNHCRYADPMILGWLARAAEVPLYAMASWHLFNQSKLMKAVMTTMGAFSVYREGVDRQSLDLAIEMLTNAERPLVIFPEGSIFRTNDRLQALLDGVAFIARAAAKKRDKQFPGKRVVIHPVAIKYLYQGADLAKSLEPVLSTIEHRLTWSSPCPGDMLTRAQRAVLGVLALKEVEHLGEPQQGTVAERQQRLIDFLLDPLELEWLGKKQEGGIVPRVKALRMKILPDMTTCDVSATERDRRWKQLANIYLSQQIASYPPDYIVQPTTPTRILETIERLEEDLTDKARVHPPLHAIIDIGKAIPIPLERGPRGEEDPVMKQLRNDLQRMLAKISPEAGGYP